MKRRTLAALLIIAAALAIGCGNDRPSVVAPPPAAPDAIRVTSVSPNTGGSATSTTIQINGAGFVSGATLTLDGRGTIVNFVGSTLLRATAPPHAVGAIDIVVTNPNGDSSRLDSAFTYVEAPLSLEITGNVRLEGPGEQSQLTATALFEDGRTQDVTQQSAWFSSFPSVATISATGLLTAGGLGSTQVLVRYPSTGTTVSRLLEVTVSPVGTFALTGRAREPGAGGIAGVTVVHIASGASRQTDDSGYFVFGGLTGSARFRLTRDNYEPTEREVIPGDFFDVPLQRVVRLEPGAPVYSSRLAPNDMEYLIGGTTCQPCRMIRIASATIGTGTVTLRWTTAADLHVWTDGRMIDAAGPVREIVTDIQTGRGETVIFIGKIRPAAAADYVPFTLSVTGAQ
jgi:hypothetical protein